MKKETNITSDKIENLPLPFETFMNYRFNIIYNSIEDYKSKLTKWKIKSSRGFITDHDVNNIASFISNKQISVEFKNWLKNHKDKIEYIPDFSGLVMGINIIKETGEIDLRDITDSIHLSLYPMFNNDNYKKLDLFGKLDWIYDNCTFIPIRVIRVISVSPYPKSLDYDL